MLVKNFPAIHGTRRFITALTGVRQISLSFVSPSQSLYPHSTSWRSVLILSSHLRWDLPSCVFPSGFPTRTCTPPSAYPYTRHAQPISIMQPNRCTNFSSLFWSKFYMFPTGPLSINMRFSLYTAMIYVERVSLQLASTTSVLILLASCQQTCMTYAIAVCTVNNSR
jgi:hypothetical protein